MKELHTNSIDKGHEANLYLIAYPIIFIWSILI